MHEKESKMLQIIRLEETSVVTVAAAVIVVFLATIYYFIRNRNILPGPKGVPYLGLFPSLKDDTLHLQLTEYTKKYGDVFSFNFCGQLFIQLASVESLREFHVTKSDCFTQRTSNFSVFEAMFQDGLFLTRGEVWKTQRKFFIQKFREYGLNSLKDSMASPVNDCVEAALKSIYKKQKEPVNIVHLLTQQCTVLLRTILFGEKGITDEEMYRLNEQYAVSLESMFGTGMIVMGPFGRFLFSVSSAYRNSLNANKAVRRILHTSVSRIEANMSEADPPTCLVEEYIKERNERRKQGDPLWKSFTDKSLVASLLQFAGDGIGSVASFMSAFLNCLVQYPEEAEKIYQEIMDVVGPSRQPTLEDKANLPYTTAFVNEVMRTISTIPIFPSLECTSMELLIFF